MGANRPVCCTQRAESELGELRESKERAEGELEGQLGGSFESSEIFKREMGENLESLEKVKIECRKMRELL